MTKLLLLFLLTFQIPIHAQSDLPCFDSSEICAEKLTVQAIANSEEIKVIDATIKFVRRNAGGCGQLATPFYVQSAERFKEVGRVKSVIS